MPLKEGYTHRIFDNDGSTVALVGPYWCDKINKALNLMVHLEAHFPGLVNGETPVNGADLVNSVTGFLYERDADPVGTVEKSSECSPV
jgi:hypothetical protein